MKCLVKYMHTLLKDECVIAEAKWAPSFELNQTLTLDNFEFKIGKVYEKEDHIKYTINLTNPDYKIPSILVQEEALLEEDEDLIECIKKLIRCKKFELEFTKEILSKIYKKSK
jgi:hypothetical protein